MHILINNKNLYFNNNKVKCAIGKRGIKQKKIEGDQITPKGKFKILGILYRKDRVRNLKCKLKLTPIKKNMGWCDDSRSKHYNKIITFPFKFRAERLYRKDNIYDIIAILDYNYNPIKKNKGSAIFIHIANKKYSNTLGCVALSKNNLKKVLKNINSKTRVIIS